MFLVDTNVFLEVLLKRDKKEDCKKYGKEEVFRKFVEDIMPNIKLLSLPMELYREVVNVRKSLNLDFDDAYQYSVAKYYDIKRRERLLPASARPPS